MVSNTRGDMEMIDLRMAQNKTGQCTTLKKYKSFHGTIKSMEIVNTGAYGGPEKPFIATCGLDRFLRVHDLESSQLVSKVYLKSRSNCLLFSSHTPAAKLPARQNDDGETKEEDEMKEGKEREKREKRERKGKKGKEREKRERKGKLVALSTIILIHILSLLSLLSPPQNKILLFSFKQIVIDVIMVE